MTSARTIFLFKNDIAALVKDTTAKMRIVFNGDEDKVREEIDYRLRSTWKITLDEWNAAN